VATSAIVYIIITACLGVARCRNAYNDASSMYSQTPPFSHTPQILRKSAFTYW
jgi:dissimilatory sulfite reductase (desulfoviridin) alpha/beta subunit